MTASIQSQDPNFGGSLGVSSKTHIFSLRGYIGGFSDIFGETLLTVTAKDYCWVSSVFQNPSAAPIANQSIEIASELNYQISPF